MLTRDGIASMTADCHCPRRRNRVMIFVEIRIKGKDRLNMANNDTYGVEEHLASPDVSLGKHVRRRQRALGESLQSRRAIYLDQKFWIILRGVAAGERSAPDEIALLLQIKRAVESGIAFCPISESTFAELLKQEDSTTDSPQLS